jgi:hypothetical protein
MKKVQMLLSQNKDFVDGSMLTILSLKIMQKSKSVQIQFSGFSKQSYVLSL